MKFEVEITDTFGGEANYSWVNRHELIMIATATRRQIIKAAKSLANWTGLKCSVEDYDDGYTIRPNSLCQVMFLQWKE